MKLVWNRMSQAVWLFGLAGPLSDADFLKAQRTVFSVGFLAGKPHGKVQPVPKKC